MTRDVNFRVFLVIHMEGCVFIYTANLEPLGRSRFACSALNEDQISFNDCTHGTIHITRDYARSNSQRRVPTQDT